MFLRAAGLKIGHMRAAPRRCRRERQHDGGSGITAAGQRRGKSALDALTRFAVVDVESGATEEESTATFTVFQFQANDFAHFCLFHPDEKSRKPCDERLVFRSHRARFSYDDLLVVFS